MPSFKKVFGYWNRQTLIAACCVLGITSISTAQAPATNANASASPTPAEDVKPGEEIMQVISKNTRVKMIHLDSEVLELANRIKIVDGFNAQTVAVSALSPHRIRVHAENPGVTSLKIIDEFDSVFIVEVFVEPDTRELQAYLQRLFPGTAVEVVGLRDGVVLRGWVTDPTQIPQIITVAEQFYPTVSNQMNVGGVSQIQLHVKIMEVQRSKMRELGFNFLALGQNYAVASTVGAVSPLMSLDAPLGGPVGAETTIGGTELSFAITGNNNLFTGFLKALQAESLAKVLAEPVIVTTSGRPASMLSGGEFPILVPQGVGATSIEYREYGVRMEAVPIALGNGRLRLDIAPEVSAQDFSNSVTVDGLSVPGLAVRRVNTQVEMRFGETLMIGGLISTTRTGNTQKLPFLGELPWIGAAFSRKTFTEGETELLILVTPEMAAPVNAGQCMPPGPGEHTAIPTDTELYFDGLLEVPNYGEPEIDTYAPYQQQMIVPGTPPVYQEQQLPPGAIIDAAQNRQRSNSVQQVGGTVSANSATRSADFQFSSQSSRPRTAASLEAAKNSSRQPQGKYGTMKKDSISSDLIEPANSK